MRFVHVSVRAMVCVCVHVCVCLFVRLPEGARARACGYARLCRRGGWGGRLITDETNARVTNFLHLEACQARFIRHEQSYESYHS